MFLALLQNTVRADDIVRPLEGRRIADVIDEFRELGYPFAYSSSLVNDELRVAAEPAATEAVSLVREILAPHGLTVRKIAGVHLVVRDVQNEGSPVADQENEIPESMVELETIVVSASRYEVSRDIAGSRFGLDRRSIEAMPDVGDDPVRITQRLPGAAAGGTSARTHIRGGNDNEVGVMLNGQWLFDPYHVRDYQSVFSTIDARAISGVEIYTGGFPARYGDRMSGLILMETVDQDVPRHTELGVSVFNTSFLTSGKSGDARWLFSARRGNLDLVIDNKFGKPSYYDLFGQFAVDLTDSSTLSFNALFADDRVRIVTESDPDELEQVVSDTVNSQAWASLHTRWSDTLSSDTTIAITAFDNRRNGIARDQEKVVADVSDLRDVRQFSLRQDWTWQPSERHLVQWGLVGGYGEARYDYAMDARYFGLPALFAGQEPVSSRSVQASPDGGSFALYVSDRWRVTPDFALEWGLRWDDQTYTGQGGDAQVSPRLNLLFTGEKQTEYRLTWGRYYQSQRIHELQVEDGISTFWPAERSDHFIFGFRKLLQSNLSFRAELFHKDISRVRPRFENLFDPLGVIPEVQPDRVFLTPDSGKSSGLELSVDQVIGDWNWWASYTFARATDSINGSNQRRSWDQRHAVQAGFTWRSNGWTASAAAGIHSGWPATDLALVNSGTDAQGEPDYIAVPGPRNALQYNNFVSVDVRVSRKFDVKHGSLTVFAEISNVFNRRNECCIDWDLADDQGSIPALESSNDYWLPLLPAVGFLWEF